VMGFPESGPFEAAPARIAERITISGPDIYASGRVERESYTVRGTIRQGNSGGPMVNTEGDVLGVVFGASVDNSDIG
ncbi:trypsin-like peptidase domain-containing protein, partial [Bacteroides thetaiotaomicron]|uniref:trypsin-like serine protease n=1 Tax=Bacteroides thetaiotaomicron TaxID=818 RepID=UPI001DA9EC06|nr:trypsin-like peptidase domain-containing protein [Bacteroides thetaiotaomicron]